MRVTLFRLRTAQVNRADGTMFRTKSRRLGMLDAQELAETIEQACWSELYQNGPGELRQRLGLRLSTGPDAFVLAARGVQDVTFNRAMALPGKDPLLWLEQALDLFAEEGIERFLLQPTPALLTPALSRELERRGLVPFRRAWAQFVRGREPVPSSATDLLVVTVTPELREGYGSVLARNFNGPPAMGELFATALDRPGWHGVVALDGVTPVASGALFIEGELAYLAGGATEVAYRRRGAQAALMAERIRIALERGCRWIVTETGEAVAGEPNHSYNNMLRAGFQVVYSRPNFAPSREAVEQTRAAQSRVWTA
jgi:hypothetical protein